MSEIKDTTNHTEMVDIDNDELYNKILTEHKNERGWSDHTHMVADGLLCEELRKLGYVKAAKLFDSLEKWYS